MTKQNIPVEPWKGLREEWKSKPESRKEYKPPQYRGYRFGDRGEDWLFAVMMTFFIAAALVYFIGMATVMHDRNECRRANVDYEQTGACE